MPGSALPWPISVGRVRAGEWASTVPDLLVAEGRYGVAIGEPVEAARAELEQAIAEACSRDPWLAEHPVEVEWWGGQFASGQTPAGSAIERQLGAAHWAVHGREPGVHGVPYGSDQRLLTGLGGVPAVLYGPGDVRHAHSPEEYVRVEEMVAVTRTLVRLVAQVCGTTSDGRAR
jgi:acetylornithine deacetylase